MSRLRFRPICMSAIQHSPSRSRPIIKKFPVVLHISLPDYDHPTLHSFTSFEKIANFLAPKHFFVDPSSGTAIHMDQVENIDPGVVYDMVGPGLTHCQKGLSRDQLEVVDKVFEEKAALALKAILEKEDPGIVELSRVVRDKKGKDVAEWEAIFQSSDGCVIFLEVRLRMSMSHVYEQSERMSRSLRALGQQSRTKLFLAGYYWHDDKSCISYTQSQGYGIIQPNGKDLSIKVMALEKQL